MSNGIRNDQIFTSSASQQALIVPVVQTNPSSDSDGTIIYNSTLGSLNYWNGGAWTSTIYEKAYNGNFTVTGLSTTTSVPYSALVYGRLCGLQIGNNSNQIIQNTTGIDIASSFIILTGLPTNLVPLDPFMFSALGSNNSVTIDTICTCTLDSTGITIGVFNSGIGPFSVWEPNNYRGFTIDMTNYIVESPQ